MRRGRVRGVGEGLGRRLTGPVPASTLRVTGMMTEEPKAA